MKRLTLLLLLALFLAACEQQAAPPPPPQEEEPGLPGGWYYELKSFRWPLDESEPAEYIEPYGLWQKVSTGRAYAVYALSRNSYTGEVQRNLVDVANLLDEADYLTTNLFPAPTVRAIPRNTYALEIYVYRELDGKRYRYDYDFAWVRNPDGYLEPQIAYREGGEIASFPAGMVTPWENAEGLKYATIPQAFTWTSCEQADWPGKDPYRPGKGAWFVAEERFAQTAWQQYWWNDLALKNGEDPMRLYYTSFTTFTNSWEIGSESAFPRRNDERYAARMPAYGHQRLVYFFYDTHDPANAEHEAGPTPFTDQYWRYFAEIEAYPEPDGSVRCGVMKWGAERVTDPDAIAILEEWRTNYRARPVTDTDVLPEILLPTPWR